ncbi:MAG TPA: hypothetical protein ENH62_07770 [Marinobacter sp.]|jgi:hypothetical protein|uniref:DUF2971 domain-containing protein n=2 Tax=root TaxID=1 RepID=A0A831R3Q1_9GAMM|nr:hypothetical protein [Marinobacter antarcticus]HDZ38167.1 hypothetical protein [Marinobacter sp.]HEA53418.1 hypothetical protein [Marinobacter antarcticus]HIM72731.1 hypothetical protein [Alphaproteobacteria bacterium]
MIIQRYMDLPRFLGLVQTRSLYLSKMSAFEDALEGGLTVDDFFKTSNAPALIDLAMTDIWPRAAEPADERDCRLESSKSAQSEIMDRQFSTPFGSYPRDDAERLFPACREWIYVSCWHHSEHECSAMWQLYGRDKNSVCIFSTDEQLKAAIALDSSCDRLEIKQVNYICHINDSFSASPLDPFLAKSKPYAFERETRVVAWNSGIDLSTSPKNEKSGLLLKVNLGKMIQKVVVSPRADRWFKEIVKNLCEEALLNVEVEDSVIRMEPVSDIYQAMAYNQSRNLET